MRGCERTRKFTRRPEHEHVKVKPEASSTVIIHLERGCVRVIRVHDVNRALERWIRRVVKGRKRDRERGWTQRASI